MLIARKEKQTHWYLPDGTPFYEVPRADGKGLRPSRITDAVKVGAFRSVTNVLSVLGKPGLVNWQIEQGIIAAITLPRRPGETDHDFAHRALADSEEQVVDAAKDGSRLHDLAAEFLVKNLLPVDQTEAALLTPFVEWARENILRTIYSETVVVNPAMHYAGRLDAFVALKSGGYAILDIKTQNMGTANGALKPTYYDEWPLQLSAYAQCEKLQFWTPANHKLISIVLNRESPGFGVKEWTADSGHFEAFKACCQIWSYIKGCTPGLKEAA